VKNLHLYLANSVKWVDGDLIIDGRQVQSGQTYSSRVTIQDNPALVRVEYFENRGQARIQLDW
jgi:hypothetical protein